MTLRFYNTLSRTIENFHSIDKNKVRMYTCGPTVYNYAHIGNLRAYLNADILKRVLLYEGFDVHHIMNLTDVDDKTIRDSQKENKSLKDFTEFYTEKFFEDIQSLNILPPKKFTKATENIEAMLTLIQKLITKGLAYKSEDGSVYFDIKNFKNYGKLSHIVIENQKENASGRIKNDEYEKDNIQDFALWKAWDEKDGDVFWEPSIVLGTNTQLEKGRPGWHIECSAMSMKFLGEQLDIHTGGVDLIFPHHENEIAQSEGATEEQFVKYWLHNEWVLVDSQKMAKSAGNFYTLRDVIEKDISPLAFRFWVLMANYRTKINFVWEALKGGDIALKRLYRLYVDLGEEIGNINHIYQDKFKSYLEDDLDTSRALSLVWDLIKDKDIVNADKKATILDFDKVLGLGFENSEKIMKSEIIPEGILKLVKEREEARNTKKFEKSDELRKEINTLGYDIEDSTNGQKIFKK